MGLKYCFLYFSLTIALNKHCQGCTPFTASNLGSVDDTLLATLIDSIKGTIPVINTSTIPDFDSFINQFMAGLQDEDIYLNITQLLTKYGYPNEQHQIQTTDGYLLDIFRIPGNGPIAFIMHGLLSSSDDFISTKPERALAYQLADFGYDVWLGNARGNVHGRKHITLSPDCQEFWDFTWDEIGRYDVPNTIDYILNATKQEKLAYIGHSQGCTSFFVMASELPEYNTKISVMIALSAVSFLKHSTDPILDLLAPFTDPIYGLTKAIGLYEFVPRNQITDAITSTVCGTPLLAATICNNILFILYGFDYLQVNATLLPVAYAHFPAGCATKQLVHYGQEIVSGKFRQYDHGISGNYKKYGSVVPPDYPLDKITSKVALFHADNDYLFTDPDRATLTSNLPNVIETYRVSLPTFTHADFIFANDVRTLVYDKLVEILKNNV